MTAMIYEEKQFVDSILAQQQEKAEGQSEEPPPGTMELVSKVLEDLDLLRNSLPMAQEFIRMNAILTKTKFDSLIEQGFTEAQALELSKKLF